MVHVLPPLCQSGLRGHIRPLVAGGKTPLYSFVPIHQEENCQSQAVSGLDLFLYSVAA